MSTVLKERELNKKGGLTLEDIVTEDTRKELIDLVNRGCVETRDIREFVDAGVIDNVDIASSLQERLLAKAGVYDNTASISILGKSKEYMHMISRKTALFINKFNNRESTEDKAMHEAKRMEIKNRLSKTIAKDKE